MKKSILLTVVRLVLAATASTGIAMTMMDNVGDEVVVTLEECPEAVQITIKEHLHGGMIEEIERETEKGIVTFSIEVEKPDKSEFEFEVAEDGTFLGYEIDNDDDDRV